MSNLESELATEFRITNLRTSDSLPPPFLRSSVFQGVLESVETMQFGLSESQQILKDTARKFFAGESPIAAVRKAMETETAYDAALWTKLAEQGFTGIIAPEEFGGMGLGKVELILLMEEAGYALLPGPFFSTVALAGTVIDACGSPEQKKKYLGRIAAGQARSTVALVEAAGSWDTESLKISSRRQQAYGNKTVCHGCCRRRLYRSGGARRRFCGRCQSSRPAH